MLGKRATSEYANIPTQTKEVSSNPLAEKPVYIDPSRPKPRSLSGRLQEQTRSCTSASIQKDVDLFWKIIDNGNSNIQTTREFLLTQNLIATEVLAKYSIGST